jgi:hypothetical protein
LSVKLFEERLDNMRIIYYLYYMRELNNKDMMNEEIAGLELVQYVDLLEGMAALNGSTPEQVNYDYFVWHSVVSEERFEEAKCALAIRRAVLEYVR